MATSFRRRQEGVPATSPKFFKIILHPQSDTLRIPTDFTRRHGQNLRNCVFLKVPQGSVTEVELIQSSSTGETWLQNGWLGFVERYSIGFGYLLVFTYNGNSQFDVLIFDPTASEIIYPVEGIKSESDDYAVNVVLQTLEVSRNPSAKNQQDRENRIIRRNNNTIELPPKSKPVAKETCTAYQKANAYKCGAKSNSSCQKPFFISVMNKSCVSAKFQLCVPVSVIKTIIPSNGTENLQLMMNGRKWCVKCWVEAGYRSAKLSIGWRKFVEDNGLKVGDACIFEANKSTEFVWDVIIFRS